MRHWNSHWARGMDSTPEPPRLSIPSSETGAHRDLVGASIVVGLGGKTRGRVFTGCWPNPNLVKINNPVKTCIQQNQEVKFSLWCGMVAECHKIALGNSPYTLKLHAWFRISWHVKLPGMFSADGPLFLTKKRLPGIDQDRRKLNYPLYVKVWSVLASFAFPY